MAVDPQDGHGALSSRPSRLAPHVLQVTGQVSSLCAISPFFRGSRRTRGQISCGEDQPHELCSRLITRAALHELATVPPPQPAFGLQQVGTTRALGEEDWQVPGTRVVIDADNVLYWRPPRSVATLTELVRAVRERFGAAADVRLVGTDAPTPDTATLREEATRVGAQLTLVPPKRGSSVDVMLAVQVMEAIPDGVERVVFASLDRDLVAVIPALKRAGIYTTLLTPPDHAPVQLALAADELVDMTALTYVAEGLISPGATTKATGAVTDQFGRATRDIAIIDPYVDAGTIKLLLWVPSTVDVTVVGSRITADARAEADTLRAHGRRIRIADDVSVSSKSHGASCPTIDGFGSTMGGGTRVRR